MTRLVVADASPLIALYDGGELKVLQLAFDEVLIPNRVHREVFESRARVRPRWIKIRSITKAETVAQVELFRNTYFLDRGESEAIALARELDVDVLLDERNARGICRELGIPHVSAYETACQLAAQGRISDKAFRNIARALRLHGGFTPGYEDTVEITHPRRTELRRQS